MNRTENCARFRSSLSYVTLLGNVAAEDRGLTQSWDRKNSTVKVESSFRDPALESVLCTWISLHFSSLLAASFSASLLAAAFASDLAKRKREKTGKTCHEYATVTVSQKCDPQKQHFILFERGQFTPPLHVFIRTHTTSGASARSWARCLHLCSDTNKWLCSD